jgi:hypothetical protein
MRRFQCGPCRIKESRRLVLPRTYCFISKARALRHGLPRYSRPTGCISRNVTSFLVFSSIPSLQKKEDSNANGSVKAMNREKNKDFYLLRYNAV